MQSKYMSLVVLGLCLITAYSPLKAVADTDESKLLTEVLNDRSAATTATAKYDLHEFIMIKVVPGKRFEFLDFLSAEFVPLQKEDPSVKHLKYYVEDRGEWDVIMVMTFNDYADVGKSRDGIEKLLKRKYADDGDRRDYWMRLESYMAEHKHLYYRDVPAFEK